MIIPSEKMKDVEAFMSKLDRDMGERKVTDFRIARLKNDLQAMSRDRMSVERSKDEKRIGRFNTVFISKLAELSTILQKNGFTNRDEVVAMVRKIKQQ